MAIPDQAVFFTRQMDPSDVVDFAANFFGTDPLLDNGEAIYSFTITALAEATALGLVIGTGANAPSLISSNTAIKMWFSIDPSFQSNAAFAAGASLPVQLTIVTTSTPPRTYQRTVVVKVVQL